MHERERERSREGRPQPSRRELLGRRSPSLYGLADRLVFRHVGPELAHKLALFGLSARFAVHTEAVSDAWTWRGLGLPNADAARLTPYLAANVAAWNEGNLEAFMAVKDRYVKAPYPAWTAIGITELAIPGGLVEIRVTARMPG